MGFNSIRGVTEDEMVRWHHQLNWHELEQAPGDHEGQGSLACCSPRGHKESDMTEWMNNPILQLGKMRSIQKENCFLRFSSQWGLGRASPTSCLSYTIYVQWPPKAMSFAFFWYQSLEACRNYFKLMKEFFGIDFFFLNPQDLVLETFWAPHPSFTHTLKANNNLWPTALDPPCFAKAHSIQVALVSNGQPCPLRGNNR